MKVGDLVKVNPAKIGIFVIVDEVKGQEISWKDTDGIALGRLWELYEEAHTPWEWHAPIFSKAREVGLDCISSAFDASSVDFLLELDVDAIKIASFAKSSLLVG